MTNKEEVMENDWDLEDNEPNDNPIVVIETLLVATFKKKTK